MIIPFYDRARGWFTDTIWKVRLADLPRHRAWGYRLARIAATTVQGFWKSELGLRAAALTYYSVLSIVPFLAFAFAVLKGFGAYRTFLQGTVRPYLKETFAANAPLYDAIDRILRFVDQTDVSRLGTVGMAVLVWTSVTLVGSVEAALNHVFGARAQRPLLRQVTDYVTLLVTTPILIVAATTVSAAAQSSSAVGFLRESLGLGAVIDTLLGFTSTAVVWLALFAMYQILPNVRVRPLSALAGALVAAIGWQVLLVLQIQLQVGVARYSALYSVLGAIPIFFVWTYLSWIIVLLGAQIAASHQNEQVVRQRLHEGEADQALREALAVGLGARVAQAFLTGAPRPTQPSLAAALEVPPQVLDGILAELVAHGIFVRAVAEGDVGYLPGRDVDAVRVTDLADALRRDPRGEGIRESVERQLGPGLQRILRDLSEARRGSAANLTLRELAALAGLPGGGDAADGAPPAPPEGEALDGKQPDVPA